MSNEARLWASRVRVGDAAEKLLLLTLAGYANENGESWYSQEKLFDDTEIPVRTLRRKLQSLEEKGLLTITAQWRKDGSRTASRIRLLINMEIIIGQPDRPSIPANLTDPPATQMAAPSATCMAEQESSSNRQRKSKRRIAYSEEFETEVWQPYPFKDGTSKANAFKKYEALVPEDQQLVKATIPVYARMKEREKFSHHLEFYISRRIFETVGMGAAVSTAAQPEFFDRKTWENLGRLYQNSSNWHREWGPEPGEPGCRMPPDLAKQFVMQGTSH